MLDCHCFKENCLKKPSLKCECEESDIFCETHAFEHILKASKKRHQGIEICFKPLEETKHLVIQKLIELKKDIKILKKKTTVNSIEVIKYFITEHQRHLDQITEVEKKCSKYIEALLNDEEFFDVTSEDQMESVIKLNAQQAKTKMTAWDVKLCSLDFKEISTAICKIYEIPFNPFGQEVESNELSFFRKQEQIFTTINLDEFRVSSTFNLNTEEAIMSNASSCFLPDKTYFYCCNVNNKIPNYTRAGRGCILTYVNQCSGLAFTIDNSKNVRQLPKSKVNFFLDPVFYDGFIYLLGGNNKLAERYDFKQNEWQSIAPLPQDLNFTYSCNALFGDSILIADYSFQKIIIYSIAQNTYEVLPNFELNVNCYKFMLKGNNRIYLFEKGKRIFESALNDISSWSCIDNNSIPSAPQLQSVVIRYKGSLYFVHFENELWRFDLSSKKL